MLNFFGLQVRCNSSYFLGANEASWFWAHFRYNLFALSNILQLASVLLLYAIRCTSSTNFLICTRSPELAQSLISRALKKRKRIGEIGDLWGIPVFIKNILLVFLPIVNKVDRPPRKFSVYLMMMMMMMIMMYSYSVVTLAEGWPMRARTICFILHGKPSTQG